jgi:hypothetical protein
MATDATIAVMSQVIKAFQIRQAEINSNWDKLAGGGDLRAAEALAASTIAAQADLATLGVLAGKLTGTLSARAAGV